VLLCLIIQDLTFFFTSLLRFELATNTRVAKCNEDGLSHVETRFSYYLGSNRHHNNVKHSWVSNDAEFSFFVNFSNSHHHVCSWDANLVKHGPSIVFTIVANFGTDIAS
jgi:hypothetical protein